MEFITFVDHLISNYNLWIEKEIIQKFQNFAQPFLYIIRPPPPPPPNKHYHVNAEWLDLYKGY